MSVLEDSPESANLARRMRNELSESRVEAANITIIIYFCYNAGTFNKPDPERLKRKGNVHHNNNRPLRQLIEID